MKQDNIAKWITPKKKKNVKNEIVPKAPRKLTRALTQYELIPKALTQYELNTIAKRDKMIEDKYTVE